MTRPLAAAHDSGPRTARAAASQHNKTGKARAHAIVVMQYIRAHPGATAPEVGAATGLGHIEAQRRLSDCAAERGGFAIRKGPARRCSVRTDTSRKFTTWLPREQPPGKQLELL